jgi:hypothetical protein
MDNEKISISEEVISRTLSIIKDIDILMETEKDQDRLMELLHLKEALINSIKPKDGENLHLI